MNQKFLALSAAAIGFLLLPANPEVQAQQGRFVMERTEGGFVRLDTFTGEMSVCNESDGQIVCRMAADERRALEEEIDLLEERITELENARTGESPGEQGMLPTEEETYY